MNDQLPHNPQGELSRSGAREISAPMVLQLGQPDQGSGQVLSFNVLWRSLLQRLTVAIPLVTSAEIPVLFELMVLLVVTVTLPPPAVVARTALPPLTVPVGAITMMAPFAALVISA